MIKAIVGILPSFVLEHVGAIILGLVIALALAAVALYVREGKKQIVPVAVMASLAFGLFVTKQDFEQAAYIEQASGIIQPWLDESKRQAEKFKKTLNNLSVPKPAAPKVTFFGDGYANVMINGVNKSMEPGDVRYGYKMLKAVRNEVQIKKDRTTFTIRPKIGY